MSFTVFWFRRDLRLDDNAGLYFALKEKGNVQPLFIFDRNILDKLEIRKDPRILFILNALSSLQSKLIQFGSSLKIFHGDPLEVFKELVSHQEVSAVYCNHDYEPYARERDQKIKQLLQDQGIEFKTFKDQVIFEKDEILKSDRTPYTVFTPYMNRWKGIYSEKFFLPYDTSSCSSSYHKTVPSPLPSPEELGFRSMEIRFPDAEPDERIIRNYHLTRDIPSIRGTSRMSVHLRFGTVSVRHLVHLALQLNEKWLNELIWREFYMGNILWHFPNVVSGSFKPAYD